MTDADTLTDPLADPAAERRLAAIVAVDVAGYSARSETDEAAAVRAVQGLAGRIGASLAEHQTPTVSEEAAASPGRGGARLLLRGVARRAGDRVVLDVRLEDRRNRQIVWSSSFERPAAEAEALDEQASVKVTDVVSYAIRTLRDQYSDVGPETLATMLKLADINRSGRLRADERVAVDRRLIKLAPKLAIVHADLAFDLALTLYGLPAAAAPLVTAEVRRESAEALRLNPKEANAYAALYALTPDLAYGQREALLNKALASDPTNENLNNAFAHFRRATGRLRDSEPFYRKALTLDPLSPAKTATVIFALAGSGRTEESWDLALRAFDRYVDNSSIARALLYTAILYQPPDAALAAIDRVQAAHRFTDDRVATLWRDYVNTARRGRTDPAVIRRMAAAALAGQIDPSTSASALALAGDADGALRVWNGALDRGGVQLYAVDLFEDAARNLRSDPRFWLLTKRLGLNAYWRASGVWPDFCAEPGLGYDCKVAAAKAGF